MSELEEVILDEIDKSILNEIQSDFPIEARPYLILGQKLGLGEEEILARVNSLRDRGVIRRIGGNFSSGGVGLYIHPVRGQGAGGSSGGLRRGG